MTILGKIFRTVAKVTGTYDVFYSGDATKQAAEQGQAAAVAYQTQLQESINKLFGGLAEKVGTSAGSAAGAAIPVWVWPVVAVLGIGAVIAIIYSLMARKGGRRR